MGVNDPQTGPSRLPGEVAGSQVTWAFNYFTIAAAGIHDGVEPVAEWEVPFDFTLDRVNLTTRAGGGAGTATFMLAQDTTFGANMAAGDDMLTAALSIGAAAELSVTAGDRSGDDTTLVAAQRNVASGSFLKFAFDTQTTTGNRLETTLCISGHTRGQTATLGVNEPVMG